MIATQSTPMPSSTNTSPSSSQSSNTLGEIPNLPTAQVTYPPTADLIFEGEVCEDIHTIEIYSMKLCRPHITLLNIDNFNSVEPHAPYTKIPSSTPLSGTSANPALITYPPTMELIFEGQVCRCWHSSNSFYWNTSTSYIIISSTHRVILTTQIPCNQCVMCKDFDEPTFKYCNQQLETAHLFTNRRHHFWRPGEYHFMK